MYKRPKHANHTDQVQHGQRVRVDETVECKDLVHLQRGHQRAPALRVESSEQQKSV